MADFYRGFVYERDVRGRLTVEGRPIESDCTDGRDSRSAPPTDASRARHAEAYIERSGWRMARERVKRDHLKKLRRGRDYWNLWRRRHPEILPMLADHDFTKRDSTLVLDGYDFSYTNLTQACLRMMSLRNANFHQAILAKANFSYAHLEGSNFCRTDFYETDFSHAFLTEANLQGVQLARTNLANAHLDRCRVYGLAAWDVELAGAGQSELLILYEELVGGRRWARQARVNGVDVASFIYFSLNNRNIARIVDATTTQWVLLLGRFRIHKEVLEQLAQALRLKGLIPIIFDFDRSKQRDLVESIILLGGLSRFIVVDISDPQSTPLELHAIVPNFAVPVQPIMRKGTKPFGVFSGLLKYPWVRQPLAYTDSSTLAREVVALIVQTEVGVGIS